MKKKAIVAGLLGMVCVLASPAQEMQRVKSVEPKLGDVFHVMNDLGIHVFRFDLGGFLDAVYEVEGYVAEYKTTVPLGMCIPFTLETTYALWTKFPRNTAKDFATNIKSPKGKPGGKASKTWWSASVI